MPTGHISLHFHHLYEYVTSLLHISLRPTVCFRNYSVYIIGRVLKLRCSPTRYTCHLSAYTWLELITDVQLHEAKMNSPLTDACLSASTHIYWCASIYILSNNSHNPYFPWLAFTRARATYYPHLSTRNQFNIHLTRPSYYPHIHGVQFRHKAPGYPVCSHSTCLDTTRDEYCLISIVNKSLLVHNIH